TDGVEDVPLGEDADAGAVGVQDHGRAHPAGGHQGGGLSECVGGADGEDHGAHGVTDEHGWSHLLLENARSPAGWPARSRFHKFTSGGTLRVAGKARVNKRARAAGWGRAWIFRRSAMLVPLSNAG